MTGKPDDASREGAQISVEGRMSYSDYLHLERLLDAQEPLTSAHDELLFIIQHQTSELWMKLAIHEIRSAMLAIRQDELRPAFKMLTRVARIFEQLNNAWDVLRTMTPSEYTDFRRWRFNHVTTDERIIGLKRGTGGTAGVSYLRRMLEVVLFPELWKVRTEL